MSDSNRREHAAPRRLAIVAGVVGAALLIVGLVSLPLYQHQHTQEGEAAATYQTKGARGEVQVTCVQEPRTRTYRCTADVPIADQHDPYAQHDLRAQQDMARWAYVVALVSFGTLLLTGAGVMLLWWTLEATRAAVSEAEKATSATMQGVALAKAGQRAFVFAEIASHNLNKWMHHTTADKGLESAFFRCKYRLVNYGSTPAIIDDVTIGFDFAEVPPPPIVDRDRMEEMELFRRHLTFRANKIEQGEFILPADPTQPKEYEGDGTLLKPPKHDSPDFYALAAERKRVFVLGRIRYRDIDNAPHETHFCFAIGRQTVREAGGPEHNKRT